MSSQIILINAQTDALIHVDVQRTFMAGGGLPVPEGDRIIPVVLRVNKRFPARRTYATLDKHPRGHISLASSYAGFQNFAVLTAAEAAKWTEAEGFIRPHARFTLKQLQDYLASVGTQVLWPDHGIIGSDESHIHPALWSERFKAVIHKGLNPACDSYSGFKDNLGESTGLGELLRQHGVQNLFVDGLAFDYCVGWTALDAKKLGFGKVYVIEDATRAVAPDSAAKMRDDLLAAGVEIIRSDALFV